MSEDTGIHVQGGREMQFLWELTGKLFGVEKRDGMFLSANVLLWSIATFIVGALFCTLIGHVALVECVANLMCVAVYAGVIVGLFGGIFFLMRRHGGKSVKKKL